MRIPAVIIKSYINEEKKCILEISLTFVVNVLIAQVSFTHSEAKRGALKLRYTIDRMPIVTRLQHGTFVRFVSCYRVVLSLVNDEVVMVR